MTLIDIPIKTHSSPHIFKTEDGFAFRITDELDSKMTTSRVSKENKTYILLKISENDVKIEGIAHKLFYFADPIDFMLPKTDTSFYYNFYETLLSPNTEDVFSLVDKIDNPLPIYLPPNLSFIRPFKAPPLHPCFTSAHDVKVIKFNWESSLVPTGPDQSYYDYLMKKDGDILFKRILNEFNRIVVARPVLSKNDKLIDHTCFNEESISRSHFMFYLPLVCYFTNKGPFNRCWIRFGFDPRKDVRNYIYQRISKFKLQTDINFLHENPVLLAYIEKNEKRFVKHSFDNLYGFFKDDLVKYMKRYFRDLRVEKMIESNED